jgi:nucleotide-binding universal stress UspA family protein
VTLRILVALDAAHPSPEAEQLALTLADATGAELLLATVFPYIDLHSRIERRHLDRVLGEECDAFLAARAGSLRKIDPELQISTRVLGCHPAGHGLRELAGEEHADLIVLGPTRRGRAGRHVPGTMAARLCHHAPCAIAVAPHGCVRSRLTRVGVAFTATDDGIEALRAGAALAERAGAGLRVISVAAPLPWMDVIEPAFEGEPLQELYRDHVADQLDAAIADLPEQLPIEAETLEGDVVAVLTAEATDLDVLVCGARGHGALGSVSHALLAAAPCPLLIAPHGARRPLADALPGPLGTQG